MKKRTTAKQEIELTDEEQEMIRLLKSDFKTCKAGGGRERLCECYERE